MTWTILLLCSLTAPGAAKTMPMGGPCMPTRMPDLHQLPFKLVSHQCNLAQETMCKLCLWCKILKSSHMILC